MASSSTLGLRPAGLGYIDPIYRTLSMRERVVTVKPPSGHSAVTRGSLREGRSRRGEPATERGRVVTESWWRLARAGPDALLCFDPCRHTLTTHSPAERSYATFDAARSPGPTCVTHTQSCSAPPAAWASPRRTTARSAGTSTFATSRTCTATR